MKKYVKESLNENLKDELINKLLYTVYKTLDTAKKESINKDLYSMSEEDLEQLLMDYYADIKMQRNRTYPNPSVI